MGTKQRDKEQIFSVAAEMQDAAERAAYLDDACGDDRELRAEIEELLQHDLQANSMLDFPVLGLGAITSPPATDQPLTEKPGTQIGPYKLLQQIGEGGMGIVFMAEQTEPVERRVALKIIKPGMDTRQVIARFEVERQALALMGHPNIAKVLDAGTTDNGRPYFIMELVNGISITQFCDERRLDVRHRLELFADVCHAVQHAHQKGIIHRDIKPNNILVALYDGHPVPKVIDFGVAKATSQKLTEKTMFTQLGQIVGTLEYMSPEQAQRNQLDVDTRSDIYSLGVLLYELLTGETPFGGHRLQSAAFDEMMRIIREEEPPRPSHCLSSSDSLPSVAANRQIEPKKLSTLVHGELDLIVMKALEKDRMRRYKTANGFAADIQHYLTDEPVEACPPSAAYRLKKFARRNRATITAASFIGAALLLGTVISTWQAIRATRAEDLASQRLVAEQQARDDAQRERDRAKSNLSLALKALDKVYLGAIEEGKLLAQSVIAAGPDDATGDRLQPLSERESEWVKHGLEFYDQFARQNDSVTTAASDAARAYHRVGTFQASLGSLAAAEKAYRAAIQRFERLTSEQPDNSGYFSDLGDVYRGLAFALSEVSATKEALEESFQAYSRGIEVSPNDHSLYLSRAETAKSLYDQQQAEEDYQKAAQLAPDNVEVLLACFRYLRDTEKALHYAERAVDLAPHNVDCHRSLARVHGLLSHTDRALEHYARSIELDPNLPDTYKDRGILYLQLNKLELAMADINRGLELASNDGSSKGLLYYFRAKIYTASGEPDKALTDLAVVTQLWPTWPQAYDLAGEIHNYRDDYQAALLALNKAIEIRPVYWIPYKYRARAYANLRQYDKAFADLVTALELVPSDLSALWHVARPLRAASPDESILNEFFALADRAVRASGDPASAHRFRAVVYVHFRRFHEAADDFARSIELGDKGRWLWYKQALCRLAGGDDDGYRDACRAMLQQFRDSDDPIAAESTAWSCALGSNALAQYDEAVALAERAVANDDESPGATRTLGAILFRAQRTDEAIQQLTKADRLETASSDDRQSGPYTCYFSAMAHHAQRNAEEAEQWLAKAIDRTDDVLGRQHAGDWPSTWQLQVTLELLRQEAKTLIDPVAKDEDLSTHGEAPSGPLPKTGETRESTLDE